MSLTPAEMRALAAVLDRIVPPSGDGRLPGAGEPGVAGSVAAGLDEHPALRPGVAAGLAGLDAQARERGGADFAALDAADRPAVLDTVAAEHPGFLGPLVLMTYLAYYRHPSVLAALGLEARPPHPEGYAVPPTDFSLLEPVRRRRPFYRDPGAPPRA